MECNSHAVYNKQIFPSQEVSRAKKHLFNRKYLSHHFKNDYFSILNDHFLLEMISFSRNELFSLGLRLPENLKICFD